MSNARRSGLCGKRETESEMFIAAVFILVALLGTPGAECTAAGKLSPVL